MADASDSKIVYLPETGDTSALTTFREKFKKITLAGGCFDILHYGHIQFLKKSKAEGNALVILLESDEALSRRKKRKPIHTQKQRAALLAALSYVDGIVALPHFEDDAEYEKVTLALKPSVIAITEGDPLSEKKEDQAKKVGGIMKVVTPQIENLSTSSITQHAALSSDKSS